MDQFAALTESMFNTLGTVAGQQVTYATTAGSVSLFAIRSRSRVISNDTNVIRVESVTEDFIVRRADLTIAGTMWEPIEGDQVILPTASGTLVYNVADPAFTPLDHRATKLSIHTALIQTS